MLFTGGSSEEFVVHAKKYTKEQAAKLMLREMDYLTFGGDMSEFNMPTADDTSERWCRYYVRVPDWCGYEGEGGCYSYCSKGERGAFPVWVIKTEDLEK